jgi:hypothetical protein
VFDGWPGRARIAWPARGVALEIEADMDYFILYIPAGRDLFCFEPVDHPINAHNLPGRPGLTVVAPGATLRLSIEIPLIVTSAASVPPVPARNSALVQSGVMARCPPVRAPQRHHRRGG